MIFENEKIRTTSRNIKKKRFEMEAIQVCFIVLKFEKRRLEEEEFGKRWLRLKEEQNKISVLLKEAKEEWK